MLTSSRFTTVITQSTSARLGAALDNSRPISRREPNRAAVAAIQAALADLNRGYLSEAEIDGYYGSLTAQSVESFQRDYGLVADGIVGRQTLSQLDELFTGDFFRQPQGISIHVGVDRLDAAHYGDEYPLTACANDARSMRGIADSLGYRSSILLDEEATTVNFMATMRQAAADLYAGDTLLVSFSGHGSQISNDSPDEEADLMDETLCFFDRMLIDDELHMLLNELRGGVHVTLFFDSCHSGTVARMIRAPETEELERGALRTSLSRAISPTAAVEDGAEETRFVPIEPDHLARALDGDRPEVRDPRAASAGCVEDSFELISGARDLLSGKKKSIELFSGIYGRNRQLYDTVRSVVSAQEQLVLECNVISFSACQDNQLTLDGAVNGFFTGRITSAWARGGFSGSNQQFYGNLKDTGRSDITPALNTYGTNRAVARLYNRPFHF